MGFGCYSAVGRFGSIVPFGQTHALSDDGGRRRAALGGAGHVDQQALRRRPRCRAGVEGWLAKIGGTL